MEFARKNIRLERESYRGTRLVFITLCCQARKCIFADGEKARWLIECIRKEAEVSHFAVHAFCVMPDHLHALVQGVQPLSDLLHFVKVLKQKTAFQYRQGLGEALWQKKFYDHILRSQNLLGQVAWYIWMNPVRKGLCERPEDYPFSGSFTLDWQAVAKPFNPWQPVWRRTRMPA